MLIAGRVIVGVAVGIASHAVPLYIAEVAPAELRGALCGANTVMGEPNRGTLSNMVGQEGG